MYPTGQDAWGQAHYLWKGMSFSTDPHILQYSIINMYTSMQELQEKLVPSDNETELTMDSVRDLCSPIH